LISFNYYTITSITSFSLEKIKKNIVDPNFFYRNREFAVIRAPWPFFLGTNPNKPRRILFSYPKMRKAQVLDHPGFTSHYR